MKNICKLLSLLVCGKQGALGSIKLVSSRKRDVKILQDVSGIVKPSRYSMKVIFVGIKFYDSWCQTAIIRHCLSEISLLKNDIKIYFWKLQSCILFKFIWDILVTVFFYSGFSHFPEWLYFWGLQHQGKLHSWRHYRGKRIRI